MKQTKHYFGTDGIRGRVGESKINAETLLKLGWAVGKVLGKEGETLVLIGKDTRLSGYMIESALEAGLSAAGAIIKLLGPMPTPAIAYLTRSLKASAGIVISASHNAYEDNGIKLFDGAGFKLSDALELEIEAMMAMPLSTVASDKLGKAERVEDARERYIDFCQRSFPADLDVSHLRLVVDCANGATYDVAPRIFSALGATVIPMANTPDGFNINQDCGSTHPQSLQEKVLEVGADLGIALDGDGDRLIMVDHAGELLDGDELLCLLAVDLSRAAGAIGVVGTQMSNLGLEQAMAREGIAFERASVGDRYVLERLKEKGWTLGGESSGHIVNLNYTTTGDGIITALQVLRIMAASKKSLHDLKLVMTKRPQVLINVPLSTPLDWQTDPVIVAAVAAAENELNGTGRVLLRPSGTEPVVRVMVEGNDEGLVRETAETLAADVKRAMP